MGEKGIQEQSQEIEEARSEKFQTFRPTVPALENILFTSASILDHGFIRVVDYMGDDTSVVQAARVSYGRGTRKINEDRGLIRYLLRNGHTTPFEMASIKFHVKLPIFVARQWIRHRTASVNEYSARYSILDGEFYIPTAEHLASQSQTNRQGRGELLPHTQATEVLEILRSDAVRNYDHYLWMLNEPTEGASADNKRSGLARELARINLTLNSYTQWYWKINLHNLMHFVSLRADDHAQYEIRVYAEKILEIMKLWVPLSTEAFEEYKLKAHTLSRTALAVIKRMINGEKVTEPNSGLSQREWLDLMRVLKD
jgi:thymidylate synthase (FAD)